MQMKKNDAVRRDVVIYNGSGDVRIEVLADADTVWLNRQQLAKLFGRDVKTIGKHISNALREELHGLSTVAKFATVANRVSSVRAPLLPGLKNMYLQVLKTVDERKCIVL